MYCRLSNEIMTIFEKGWPYWPLTTLRKVGTSLFVFCVGVILAQVVREAGGLGYYIIHGVTGAMIIYTWRGKHPFIVPALLIAATLVLLIILGFWQLDRADEKRAIEDKIAIANSANVELVVSTELLKDKEYYHVRLQGSYVDDKQFIYDNQIVDQIFGYYVLTPFILKDASKAILINRGFIPWNGRRDKLADIDIGVKITEVKVQISKPVKRIELKTSQIKQDFPVLIQALDLDEMSAIASLDFANKVGLLSPESENGFVRKWEPYTGSIERHIGYAIQWFLMALVLSIIGVRLALKQRKK